MSDAYLPYVIRDGDFLEQVAFKLGFDCEAVWSNDKNRELRELRKGQHNLLCAGDVLYVPKKPTASSLKVSKGTSNRYVATVPTTTFDVHLNDVNGPLANESYTYTIEGVEQQGTTDGDGKASFVHPITCAEISVVFPNKSFSATFKVGHRDPIEEPSGVRQRLASLGYVHHESSGDEDADDAEVARALGRFQHANQLPATSTMDDATKAKLVEVCKS